MKWGDIRARIRGDLTGVLREGKWEVMLQPLVKFNCKDDRGKALWSTIVEMHKKCMSYVEKGDRMANILYPLRTRWGMYLRCCSQGGRSL
jgi:hypothetical protein